MATNNDTVSDPARPVPIPTDWQYELWVPGDNYVTMVEYPTTPGDHQKRKLHLHTADQAKTAGIRKQFTFAGGLQIARKLYAHFFDGRPWDAMQVYDSLDPQVSGLVLYAYLDAPSVQFFCQFVSQEPDASLPDAPGMFRCRIPNLTLAENADAPAAADDDQVDPWLVKYFAVDRRAEPKGIMLVDLNGAPKQDMLFQLNRAMFYPQAAVPLKTTTISAGGLTLATIGGVLTLFTIKPDETTANISQAVFANFNYQYGPVFGRDNATQLVGNNKGLFALINGRIFQYTAASDSGEQEVTPSAGSVTYIFAFPFVDTLLALAGVGKDAGTVYRAVFPPSGGGPPEWVKYGDMMFRAASVVGNKDVTFAVSSLSSGPPIVYELDENSATTISDLSLEVSKLVITRSFVVARGPRNKMWIYSGTPKKWIDLTTPANRPWGGARGFVEDWSGSYLTLTGDCMELMTLNAEKYKFQHLAALSGLDATGDCDLICSYRVGDSGDTHYCFSFNGKFLYVNMAIM